MKKGLFPIIALLSLSCFAESNEDEFGMEEDPFGNIEEVELPLTTLWNINFSNELQIELRNIGQDNFKFGQYNGLSERGTYLVGSWGAISRPNRNDQSDNRFWTVSIDDLGLSTTELAFSAGRQGNYSIRVDYSNLVSVGNDSGITPFLGNNVLTLPDAWVATPTTSGFNDLSLFNEFKPELERNQISLSLNKILSDNWLIDASYNFERKDGEKLIGAAFYVDAASPVAALLPETVDYTTREFDLSTQFNKSKLQVNISYHLESFDNESNEEGGLTWQNPYASGFGTESDYPNGFSRIGLAPDNRFQQIRSSGSYRFNQKFSLQFDGMLSSTEYRDTLPPYTINNELSVGTALPTSKLDDLEVNTFNLKLLSKPFRRTAFNVKYRYDERKNTMDRLPWLYPRGDALDQPLPIRAVFNNPQNTVKQQLNSELIWRLKNRTRLSLAYDFEEVTRDLVSVDKTKEDKFSGAIRLVPLDKLALRFEAAYADRAASTYQWAESFFNTFTSEQIDEIPANRRFSNHPLLRQYYLSNRESSLAKLHISYQASDSITMALESKYRKYDYDETELGLTANTQAALNLSVDYIPTPKLGLHAWLNAGLSDLEQTGRSFRGGAEQPANELLTPLPQGSDPTRNWQLDEQTSTIGFGASANWVIVQSKIDLEADYYYLKTTTEYDIETFGASDILGVPLPDNDSMLHQFNLKGNYHVGSHMTLQMRYAYYRYRPLAETAVTATAETFQIRDDWALAGLRPDTLRNVLSTGESSANEVINMLSISMVYRY